MHLIPEELYGRQLDLVDNTKLQKLSISIVGCGSTGSFTALTLAKMGVGEISLFDDDGVSIHNLPNQFYRIKDIDQYKTTSLAEIIKEFSQQNCKVNLKRYSNQKLGDIVIVCTDSMSSRRIVFDQFKKQKQCKYFIDSRMGAELGKVYTINRSPKLLKYYLSTWHPDKESQENRCTAKAIIYNVLMIASLICRSVKAIINNEEFPRGIIFDYEHMMGVPFIRE